MKILLAFNQTLEKVAREIDTFLLTFSQPKKSQKAHSASNDEHKYTYTNVHPGRTVFYGLLQANF